MGDLDAFGDLQSAVEKARKVIPTLLQKQAGLTDTVSSLEAKRDRLSSEIEKLMKEKEEMASSVAKERKTVMDEIVTMKANAVKKQSELNEAISDVKSREEKAEKAWNEANKAKAIYVELNDKVNSKIIELEEKENKLHSIFKR